MTSVTPAYVLIALLNDADADGQEHAPVAFRTYGEHPSEDDVAAVYAWAEAHGYQRDRGEVRVHVSPVLSPAERSQPSRVNTVPAGDDDAAKAALRALA